MDDLPIFYFDLAHAIEVHDWIIEHSGGLHGIRDLNPLESVLDHIQNDGYYPGIIPKLTHLVFSINKFHAFNDGNKRSSIALGTFFLALNGYDYCIKKFVLEMENMAVWVADGKIGKDLLERIIESILLETDYSETLKLEILDCLQRGQA
ncbi:type II toxin-antitoxin system death-on-curing family toxin [Candidatus Thiothrix anitrata]|uniref:Type II toxin-antitoxin system death-on-curing family toxin n=1 Tax=Candidatus Thiothrix anitrata TaxID=2823902 RepID=A0ABX7X4M1_9GAMM|nr:type II toxin-antitoxin system death-on-curing family toxin [Candidatus Thiothrix anitrata]QTR50827.1 type II toxin-antitoxin system death-on-curing family toxin [Candidatus Thiothrix anitrata]